MFQYLKLFYNVTLRLENYCNFIIRRYAKYELGYLKMGNGGQKWRLLVERKWGNGRSLREI